ncbi:MAG: alkaline phosphatase D family protein [Bradymonadia bacterium]
MFHRRQYMVELLVVCSLLFACTPSTAAPFIESGPMNGFSTPKEVAVWARLSSEVPARIRYWTSKNPGATTVRNLNLSGRDGRTASTVLTDLPPGERFGYEIELKHNGRWLKQPSKGPLRFQTQVIWQRRSDPPDFSLAFGSCAYINDTNVDSTTAPPYGGGYEIFETIAQTDPDLMLWLGDAVYLRPADWASSAGIHRRYRHARRLPDLQALLGRTHHYAIWDDHDYGPNDADWTFVHKGSSLKTFREFWMNPSYGLPETAGVFTQFSWSDADFFLLDNRYHRSSSAAPDGHDKTQLGETQLRWLLDALTTSRATFKVVVGGGQFLSPYDRWEGYAQFAYERDRLLDELRRRKVEGVFFLSGDRHHAELVKVRPDGFYPLFDFTSSPLTSRGASASGELDSPVRIDGTLVTKKRNFGMLHFSGVGPERQVLMETKDANGKRLWSHIIKASELRFSQP